MAGGVCPFTLTKRLMYYACMTGVLLLVVVVQGILLDVFIIYEDHTIISNYFWLVPDFLLVFGFVAAMASGYRNYKCEKSSANNSDKDAKPESDVEAVHLKIMGRQYLPFYIWLVYSSLLVAKIAIIFKSEVPNKLDPDDRLSAQLLKTVMSVSCIVFALLVEGQASPEHNSERDLYIKSLSHGTAMEILDSVTFISLLIQSEGRFVLPVYLENAIIFFSCLNFMLPGLALIKLSRCDYGRSPVCIVSSVLYKMCHLWFINFTYFIIRVHLWGGFSYAVSPFIVKNIYHIFSIMKSVWAELKPLCLLIKNYRNKKQRVHSATREPREQTEGMEMNATSTSTLDEAATSDKFEEIDLKAK